MSLKREKAGLAPYTRPIMPHRLPGSVECSLQEKRIQDTAWRNATKDSLSALKKAIVSTKEIDEADTST